MKYIKKHITSIVAIFLMLLTYQSVGQKSFAKSSVNNTSPEINEAIQVTYSLNFNGKRSRNANIDVVPQEFNGFEILRTSQGESISVKSDNQGNYSEVIVFNINVVIRPTQTGELTIPGLTLKYQGKSYPTDPIKIKVAEEYKDNSISNSVELRFVPNKKEAYIGETVRYDLYSYSAVSVNGMSFAENPEFNGFISELIEPKERGKQKKINGKRYTIQKIASYLLTPTKTGKLKIPSIKVNYSIFTRRGRQTILAKTTETSFKVNQLPSGAPKNFKGLVGEFSITQKTDKKKLPVNDAITTRIKIKGSGNLAGIEDIILEQPNSFEALPSTNTENISTGPFGFNGWKNYEFVSIPRQPGRFTIPPVEISYFNIKSKKYETLKTKPIHVNVTGVADTDVALYSSDNGGVNQEKVQVQGNDIRYLKTINEIQSKHTEKDYFAGSKLYYLLTSLSLIGIGCIAFVFREKNYSKKQLNSLRKNKASKKANQFLKSAKSELTANSSKFYEAIDFALSEYLLDKLVLERSQLNKSTITQILSQNKIEDELIKEFNTVSDQCKMARYSPISTSKEELYKKAEDIINQLESKLK